MIFALWLLLGLAVIVIGGLAFTALHPNLQRWGEGLPKQPK